MKTFRFSHADVRAILHITAKDYVAATLILSQVVADSMSWDYLED